MILQSLYDYYQRKPDLPREGFEWKEIPFVIEVNKNGSVVQIEDTRTRQGKWKQAKSFLVPQAPKKSSNVGSSLLWGNVEYAMGLSDPKKLAEKKRKGKEAGYKKRLKDMHAKFTHRITSLSDACKTDAGIQAVLKFCERVDFADLDRFGDAWKELKDSNPNITFRMQGDVDLICQRPIVADAVASTALMRATDGICLVTGKPDEIERLHLPIKGVRDARTSGANIVAVNDGENPAFASYGKHQGYNSPIGKYAAFRYTTALNSLLGKNSRQRIQIGDASTVFWADKPSPLEDNFSDIFDGPLKMIQTVTSGR